MKDLAVKVFKKFCAVSTMVFLCSITYITVLKGFSDCILISYVWGVLGVSFVASVGRIPFMGERELSKIRMMIYEAIYDILMFIIVFFVGYYLKWFVFEYVITVVLLFVCVVVVLCFVHLFDYISSRRAANEIFKKLKSRNSLTAEE